MNAVPRMGRKRQRGQGMTEYIIIVVVIAVLSIAVLLKFGNQIRNLFWASGTELSGQDASVDQTIMGDAADENKSGVGDL